MDPEAFLELANQVTKLKMFPYFDIAHCVICCLYAREDIGTGASQFSRKHPFANYVSCMLTIFAGGILSSLLLGEAALGVLKNNQQLMLASAVWYVIYYSPFDIGYKVAKFLPLKVVLAAMKEVYRVKKINDGVAHVAKIYPNGYVIMVIVGTLKGNGSGFMKILERLSRGVWTPTAVEFMQPGFATKASVAAGLLFVLDSKTDLISAPHALVYFAICIFFVYFKLSSLLLGIHDPFLPFENLFCAIFLGGVWDSLSRTLGGSKGGQAGTDKQGDASKNG
ncbi:TRIC channel [Trinorchestia longiramus]|nr:TRIC channel [Trinorchestia longiramus]